MTTTENSIRSRCNKLTCDFAKACVVTNQKLLIERLRRDLSRNYIEHKERLADVLVKSDCNLYIIDTNVRDMHLWPAPLLANPDANSKSWLFLLPKLSDIGNVNCWPNKAKFVEFESHTIDEVASLLVSLFRKQFDPEASKRIAQVEYLDNIRAFLVRMENANAYILRVHDLTESDSSKVVSWKIGKNHDHFQVMQGSGNWFEVPWDDILYHCEPEYAYYKGRRLKDTSEDSAGEMGKKIQQLRESKGLSISRLAEKAKMKRPNLSRLEHGKHRPSLETLERLALALDTSIAEIVAKRLPDS